MSKSEEVRVCAEIEYPEVHSDICPEGCLFSNVDYAYRHFLHTCLDEWLDKSGGKGGFYIKEEGYEF